MIARPAWSLHLCYNLCNFHCRYFQKPRLEHQHHLCLLPPVSSQEDILELKRQLSLADGQLRKSEVSRKRLEICNRKLLLFVQVKC